MQFDMLWEDVLDWTDRLRLRNLEMLLSLARTGNMSQSAEELNTTQPGLSKWLKDLEQDLGLPLFERLARGLRPTAYGDSLVSHARRIVAHLDLARDDMKAMRDGGQGLAIIGFAGPSSVDTVPTAVLKVLELVPRADIRLQENKVEALLDNLSAGQLDVVVGPSELAPYDPAIRSEVLYNEPIHVVARYGHPLSTKRSVTWEEVLSYPWALWERGTPVRTAFDKALTEAGQRYPPHFIESNSASLTTTLLVQSDMIGIASRRPALRYVQMKILSIIPLRLSVHGSVTMYWREDSFARPAVAVAVKAIREAARDFS